MADEITAYYGRTLARVMTFKDGTTPIDISGHTFYFTVKDNLTDPDSAALIAETILPAQLTDPTNGIHVLTVLAAKCRILGSKWFEVSSVDDQNNPKTWAVKKINFLPVVLQDL